jgi:NAD(P)-dependent dehydrogenase (short-subunit alcohol dehydrogenase family)
MSSNIKLKPLNDQVVVITGATSGIGLATARAFAKAGSRLVVASRNAEAVAELAKELGQTTAAIGVPCDVANEEEVRQLAQAAGAKFGGFDTWVNNAGVSIYGRIEEVELHDMKRLFETNFWGVVHGSLAAIEHLKGRGGAIINIGSVLSERAIPLQGMYCASKFAVRGFTDALRMEAEKENYPVSITLIKPAAIDTPYVQHAKNYLAEEPKNPPPVYAPDVVVEAILHCAANPERDIYAGGAGVQFSWAEKLLPWHTDKGMEATMFEMQHSGKPKAERGDAGLYQSSGPALKERGEYEGVVIGADPYTKARVGRKYLGLAALGASAVALVAWKVRK